MSNALAIARKELKVYYLSPLFYVVTALWVALFAIFFDVNVLSSFTATLSNSFNIALFILLFVAPIITMRLISQEKAQGTIELLLTMPVRDVEVVVGKYLAAMTLFASMLSFTLVSVLILLWTSVNKVQFLFLKVGHVDVGPLIAGYVGFLLIGGGYMAIGMFASSLTGNQILAAFVGFAMVLVVLVSGSIADVFQPPISDFLTFIGSNQHVSNFGNGLISVPDVVYALTMIVVPLWFTVVVLGARRWH